MHKGINLGTTVCFYINDELKLGEISNICSDREGLFSVHVTGDGWVCEVPRDHSAANMLLVLMRSRIRAMTNSELQDVLAGMGCAETSCMEPAAFSSESCGHYCLAHVWSGLAALENHSRTVEEQGLWHAMAKEEIATRAHRKDVCASIRWA